GGPRTDAVVELGARRRLEPKRAHPRSPAAARSARGRPGRLVVAAVLSRCDGGLAGLRHEGRGGAGVRLLAKEAACSTTWDAPTCASSGWSRVCSPRSALHTCSGR